MASASQRSFGTSVIESTPVLMFVQNWSRFDAPGNRPRIPMIAMSIVFEELGSADPDEVTSTRGSGLDPFDAGAGGSALLAPAADAGRRLRASCSGYAASR